MKFKLLILSTIISVTLHAQKYSSVISDSSILNFMEWFFSNDSTKGVKIVSTRRPTLQAKNFKYQSTVKDAPLFANIFARNKYLVETFTKNDADFFVKQIENQKDYYWDFKIKRVTLFDAESNAAPNNKTIYFYSIPLFSYDKTMVMISEGYVRGNDYGGGVFYLFKKDKKGWTKIYEFQKWKS